ncbi:hypothetical protein [Flexivirga oryzae]|uniref:Uncharacterized protein n=1 Tax=Flexivirga oryzae TaxID=1794944 RepID=A0A839N9N1_9MICO|nr:hypothetical protein [Flexivirga oryzae]MBB2891342.1 hypothetical protein [Flexivirga oryzae]
MEKLQPSRFDHYIDFLDVNGLKHIYTDDRHRTDAPLDRLVAGVDHAPPIATINAVDAAEHLTRATTGFARFPGARAALGAAIPGAGERPDQGRHPGAEQTLAVTFSSH